jgi:DNA-binding NtrC family response regulator
MEKEPVKKSVVLYVDDIKANLMLFEASFDEIHVLVSEQNMPGMTGNELLEIVTLEYPDIMRFMITAYTDYDTGILNGRIPYAMEVFPSEGI